MKRTLFFLFSLFFFSFLTAQTPLTQAVDFTVTTIDGEEIVLSDILAGGQYVVIDFFFTTCPPCQATAPLVNEAYEYFGCNSGDVFFLAMDTGDTDEECEAFDQTYGVHYPTVSGVEGGGNEVNDDYQIGAYPTVILINPDGEIVEMDIWPIPDAQFLIDLFESYGLTQQECTSVGVAESSLPPDYVRLSPNPTSGPVSVSAEGPVTEVTVTDAAGRVVLTANRPDSATNFDIDLSTLPQGSYFIYFQTEKEFVVKHVEKVE